MVEVENGDETMTFFFFLFQNKHLQVTHHDSPCQEVQTVVVELFAALGGRFELCAKGGRKGVFTATLGAKLPDYVLPCAPRKSILEGIPQWALWIPEKL